MLFDNKNAVKSRLYFLVRYHFFHDAFQTEWFSRNYWYPSNNRVIWRPELNIWIRVLIINDNETTHEISHKCHLVNLISVEFVIHKRSQT